MIYKQLTGFKQNFILPKDELRGYTNKKTFQGNTKKMSLVW